MSSESCRLRRSTSASAPRRRVGWLGGVANHSGVVGRDKQTKEKSKGSNYLYSNNLINLRKIPRNLCFVLFCSTSKSPNFGIFIVNKNLQAPAESKSKKKKLISVASVPFFWTRLTNHEKKNSGTPHSELVGRFVATWTANVFH